MLCQVTKQKEMEIVENNNILNVRKGTEEVLNVDKLLLRICKAIVLLTGQCGDSMN